MAKNNVYNDEKTERLRRAIFDEELPDEIIDTPRQASKCKNLILIP